MLSTALSNGHTADIKMVEQLVKGMTAKLYVDRGYISNVVPLIRPLNSVL